MTTSIPEKLKQTLVDLDGKGYKAYKKLQGTSWSYPPFLMKFEHVQGDSFAFPSRLSITLAMADAGFPEILFATATRRLALEDFLLRSFHQRCARSQFRSRGSGKSGVITALVPGQKILKRNAVLIKDDAMRFILFAGLPADGRKVLGKECLQMFAEILPRLWRESLLADSLDAAKIRAHIATLEDYEALQGELKKNGWAAFIGNGSLLPRASGVSDLPLAKDGVAFIAPEDFTATVSLPHKGNVAGMAIPDGVTLIVGGGFHGKSALLSAIQSAVYPHIPGDGRETVAAIESAVKIRAEDGRSARDVDISSFMDKLPLVNNTASFSTQSASGSTSQAVNIIEALECETKLLLMDEDTCATNFMVRDARMQALVHAEKEPVTALIDRIDEIVEKFGASVIMVMGGSGDYFESACHIIAMEWFQPKLVTEQARQIAKAHPTGRRKESKSPFQKVSKRRTDPGDLAFSRGRKETVIQARGVDTLSLGCAEVDAHFIEQLAETGQLEMCGWILKRLKTLLTKGGISNFAGLKEVYREIGERGIDSLTDYETGLLALPRIHEAMAILNRLRPPPKRSGIEGGQ